MNHIYGDDTFVVPEAFIPQVAARVMDLQDPNKKMSKSASSDLGVIFLNDSSKTIEKKLKKATTDSDTVIAYDKSQKPGVSNLLDIQSAITGQSIDELVSHYKDKMYGHLKIDTANLVIEELIPLQEKAAEYLSDKAELMRILQEGAQKAREQAFHTLSRLHRRLGFNLF
jgi:tryptophanyl-tRNA synthetase